jgi:hypothetical protein
VYGFETVRRGNILLRIEFVVAALALMVRIEA